MRQPRSEREEIKAQPTHLVRNTEESQAWPRTFPNAIDRQIQTNLHLFFFSNGWNIGITEVKSKTLYLTAPVIHLQEMNCQAFKHFSSWVILETFISCVAGSQHLCLVLLLVDKERSSFHAAAFIYISNNRIIIFPLPPPGPPFCSLSSPCFLTCSC